MTEFPASSTAPVSRYTEIAHEQKRAFLRALDELGMHNQACRVAEIAYSHPWYWRRTDPLFAELEQQAKDNYGERICPAEAWQRFVELVHTRLRRKMGARVSSPDSETVACST